MVTMVEPDRLPNETRVDLGRSSPAHGATRLDEPPDHVSTFDEASRMASRALRSLRDGSGGYRAVDSWTV